MNSNVNRIPLAALVLGLAGLIPFVMGAVGVVSPGIAQWMAERFGPFYAAHALLQGYGIVILSFMSGVIWGFATKAEGMVAATGYGFSVCPALWAFFMGTGPAQSGLIALAAGFLALLLLDAMFTKQELAPPWWMRLRVILTTVVVLCLLVGAFL